MTLLEAAGRGIIVSGKVKELIFSAAKENNIKYQVDVVEGGMTDGAVIYMNREGVLTGVLSVACRYIHAPSGVFHMDDVDAAINLAVKVLEKAAK